MKMLLLRRDCDFFISASMFGAMALYGNSTKKDLTSMGSFLMMGLFKCQAGVVYKPHGNRLFH